MGYHSRLTTGARLLDFRIFAGFLAASLVANGLTALFVYAIVWGEKSKRAGIDEANFPIWWIFAGIVPPMVAAGCAYYALY